MDDNEYPLQDDPTYRVGYNDALEWAANWITGALGGYSEETVQFANAQAVTLRAAKCEIKQQDFFDAIRNDLFMSPKLKAYWLAKEPALGDK